VLEVNGEEVEGSRDLTRRIGDLQAGERVRFLIVRDGGERTLRVTLGDRPSEDELNSMTAAGQAEAEASYFGMRLVPLSDEDRELRNIDSGTPGLVVDNLDRDSEAARKGLATGDVILEAGGRAVVTPDAFRAAVDNAREDGRSAILLLVETRGGQRYVALQLDEDEE
jgi:serine protease Do